MLDMFQRPARKGPSQEKISILLAQGWRNIEGFERYLVSREGQIFSTIRAGRFLRQTESNVGYLYVSLMAEGASEPVKVLVHRIVAKAFCDGDGQVVNHLDGNKKNNRAENLEWCSYADNNDHERTVRKSLRELEAIGLLQTVHRQARTGRGKRNMRNRYRILVGANGPVVVGANSPPNLEDSAPSSFRDLAMLLDEGE